ncbi:MAG: hypothetical protein K2H67_06630 [Treponemataceae bacterium]|nr:hypothetical protein [Treponemataceae bacterium]
MRLAIFASVWGFRKIYSAKKTVPRSVPFERLSRMFSFAPFATITEMPYGEHFCAAAILDATPPVPKDEVPPIFIEGKNFSTLETV